ncbi:MAG TPA: ATP-binding protein [Candidatus Angelobacter sp.]|nr:ATP-binding protein [Candidatus Angelobacter sp.]
MATLFDKLPTILVLAVLVGIFIALRRYVRSSRLNLWIAAWGLIFVHFIADWLDSANPNGPVLLWIVAEGALLLSGIFFVASLTSFFDNKKLTAALILLFAVPMMAYTAAIAYDRDWPALYIASSAVIFLGLPAFIWSVRKVGRSSLIWMPASVLTGVVAMIRAAHHEPLFGFLALLTFVFALPAFLYLRRYWRLSPGVITTAGGFILWGAVFPLGYFVTTHFKTPVNPELWNTPKFFVAFGMILTLLEDKSYFLAAAKSRERKANEQMQKFAGITSRLLTGVDLAEISHEIAEAISETSTFSRVSIILTHDGKTLYLAGCAGMTPEAIAQIEANCAGYWTMDDLIEIFRRGNKLGQASRLIRAEELVEYKLSMSPRVYPPASAWKKGDRVLVPLQSTRGAYVGCISLDDPRDLRRIKADELVKIELLAGDLAVTVDNASLHRQLLRSEKLAAIGQLVAGVAHELNNPLASIIGYSELMTDEIKDGAPRQKLEKMIREAHRMKRIIENLLRFARQNNLEKKSANLQTLLQDVVALREYHIRTHDVELSVYVEPGLPPVALDEDQFKQILLNLLNNSIDALEGRREKRISIEAVRRENRVLLRFDDNGPGFRDPNRAFDPFYTTKPVGKGTGLGLSICYGIVKEHGGEIQAANLKRGGARIVLELPANPAPSLDQTPVIS